MPTLSTTSYSPSLEARTPYEWGGWKRGGFQGGEAEDRWCGADVDAVERREPQRMASEVEWVGACDDTAVIAEHDEVADDVDRAGLGSQLRGGIGSSRLEVTMLRELECTASREATAYGSVSVLAKGRQGEPEDGKHQREGGSRHETSLTTKPARR